MDLGRVFSSYIDGPLARAGQFQVEWDLLLLSVEDQLSDNTRWLRTKFGMSEGENQVRIPCEVVKARTIWSPVLQYTGKLDNVGALIFIYEGSVSAVSNRRPDTRALLHEVVRQTSLQSRFKFPVLIINFDADLTNASDVLPKKLISS